MLKENISLAGLASDDFKEIIAEKKFNCWEKSDVEFNLYLFTLIIENDAELSNIWEELSNSIAYEFQSNLEKKVEIWNIYLVFLSKSKISKETKYKIEQNKYSSRKLVFDNFSETEWNEISTENGIVSFLDKKLFNLSIPERKSLVPITTTLEDLLKEDHEDLLRIISNSNTNNYYKFFFDKYLEGNE